MASLGGDWTDRGTTETGTANKLADPPKKIRKRGAGSITVGLTLVMMASTAAPADASDEIVWLPHKDGTGIAGKMDFFDNGDRFMVDDNEADGHSVTGTLIAGANTVLGYGWDRSGADDQPVYFQHNIRKGEVYTMMVCAVEGSPAPEDRLWCEYKEFKE